jgi:hypothetical protein
LEKYFIFQDRNWPAAKPSWMPVSCFPGMKSNNLVRHDSYAHPVLCIDLY